MRTVLLMLTVSKIYKGGTCLVPCRLHVFVAHAPESICHSRMQPLVPANRGGPMGAPEAAEEGPWRVIPAGWRPRARPDRAGTHHAPVRSLHPIGPAPSSAPAFPSRSATQPAGRRRRAGQAANSEPSSVSRGSSRPSASDLPLQIPRCAAAWRCCWWPRPSAPRAPAQAARSTTRCWPSCTARVSLL